MHCLLRAVEPDHGLPVELGKQIVDSLPNHFDQARLERVVFREGLALENVLDGRFAVPAAPV